MALIKCPECGKNISDKVENCPFCGCPKEYLLDSSGENESKDINKENMTQTRITSASKRAENEKTGKEEITFNIGPFQIKYPKDLSIFAKMFGTYMQLADNCYKEATEYYRLAGNIDDALINIKGYALASIGKALEDAAQILYKNGIHMTKSEFMDKYHVSYSKYLEEIEEQCDNVIQARNYVQRQRDSERGMRSRWQGGGFGLSGAVKGAITAGVLNAGTDFVRSIGDAARDKSDDNDMANALHKIYKDKNTEFLLCAGIKSCIIDIYYGLVTELKRINYFPATITFDIKKEQTIYETAMSYAQNNHKKLEELVHCLLLYPGDKKASDKIIDLIIIYDNDDFSEWLEFWNLSYRYPNFIQNRKKGILFDHFCNQNGLNSFDFGKYSVDQYIQLRKLVFEYYEKYNVKHLPSFSHFSNKINNYYTKLDGILPSLRIIEWIPLTYDIFEFMEAIIKERNSLPNTILKDIWVHGDNTSKIPQKINKLLKEDDSLPLIYYDKSFWESGGSGILVSTKYILDLKKKTKLQLCNIEKIEILPYGAISFSIGKEQIVLKDSILKNENLTKHFVNLITVICVRYAGNHFLWNKNMSTPKPIAAIPDIGVPKSEEQKKYNKIISALEKMDTIIDNYIMEHPENNKETLFKEFLKKQGITVEIKKQTVFCPYCGNKILRTTKFCNFCGKQNKYAH